jgi:hypothetical protein
MRSRLSKKKLDGIAGLLRAGNQYRESLAALARMNAWRLRVWAP